MHKYQLTKWLHGDHKKCHKPPKVYLIGCSDLSQYLLAVEFKQRIEPIKQGRNLVKYPSLTRAKQALSQMGVQRAYLRLHNAYDECGSGAGSRYCEMALALSE